MDSTVGKSDLEEKSIHMIFTVDFALYTERNTTVMIFVYAKFKEKKVMVK